jgi:hypothetical protein
MGNYEELTDKEKIIDFPEEFIEELREAYLSGREDEAIERADAQSVDLREIIN